MTADHSTRAFVQPMGSTRRGDTIDPRINGAGFREKSLVLDAAVDEYLRLQREGVAVSAAEFCERYPDYRHSLRRLIDVEEAFPSLEGLPDNCWPEVGGHFLSYHILDLLGAGSIARVYLAAELNLGGRSVAIKVSQHGGYEAETLGKLRHPNIVEVYSVHHDEATDLTAVCMPYRGSATLSDVLDAAYRDSKPPERAAVMVDVARRMALPEALSTDEFPRSTTDNNLERGSYVDGVVSLGIQLASALQYAHDHGVLHRDLKPSNVLLTPDGRPMLLDFNLSFDEALNMVHRGGTLPYSAPEQLLDATQVESPNSSNVDCRADIFSLGAILYELLTGRLAYGSPPANVGPKQAISMQLAAHQKPPTSIRLLNGQVDPGLEALISRCLEIDRAKRFSSMNELEMALRRHFEPRRRLKRWFNNHRALVASGIVTAVLALSAVGAYAASLPPYYERQQQAGIQALREQDFQDAISHFDNAIGSNPKLGRAFFLRGVARQQMQDHEKAIEDFRKAEPYFDTVTLWDHCGYSEYQLDNYEAAYKSYYRAVRLDKDSPSLLLKKAYTSFAWRKKMSAVADVDDFIRQYPDRFEGYFLRAWIAYRSQPNQPKRIQSSVEDIRSACQRTSGFPVLEFEAAKILAAASRAQPELELKTDAQSHLQKAVELGWSRKSIETCREFQAWKDEEWFLTLLERSEPVAINPKPTIAELMILPPNWETQVSSTHPAH